MSSVQDPRVPRLELLADASLWERLGAQCAFAASELRRDPRGFLRTIAAGDAFDRRSRKILWTIRLGLPAASCLGFTLGLVLYALLIGVTAGTAVARQRPDASPTVIAVVPPGAAHGGGGSGDHDPRPVSRGRVPPSSLADPIAPATAKPVPVPPDPLPAPPPVKAPPLPVDAAGPYGDPSSSLSEPSNGPGDGGGIGTGHGMGYDAGDGPGEGPGRDGGRGDGSYRPGSTAPRDSAVATRAVILNAPRPEYTELAREHKTQGAIRVRVMLGADGRVRNATVTRGLPDGLNEKAVEAVSKLRFEPARDASGRAVDSWLTISVVFTIR